MMQFVCTARSADDEDYRPLAETPLTLDFAYDHGVSTLADPAVWQVTLTNNADAPWRGVVKLEHCVACDAPRFFLPGFLYGRNRGEAPIRVDNRYPRLRAGTPEFPASPWWMVRADRLSHPAAFLLDGGRWYGLSAAPYFVRQNGVLQPWQPGRAGTFAQFAGFTCSLNTGSVGYTLGYENAPWLFVQSHNIKPRAPMGENCLTLAAGESVAFPLYLYDFVAVDGERTLYAALEAVYGLWHTPPRPGTTPSHAAELLAGAVTRDAWLPDDKNYVGITKERSDGSYEQNKIFSISWTNGLSAAVPCLQAAHRLGDKTIRAAALACIDNIVQNSLGRRKRLELSGLVVRRHVHGRAFRLSGRTDALLYPKSLSARSCPRHRPPRLARLCAGRGATAGGSTQRRRRVPVYPVGANGRRVGIRFPGQRLVLGR